MLAPSWGGNRRTNVDTRQTDSGQKDRQRALIALAVSARSAPTLAERSVRSRPPEKRSRRLARPNATAQTSSSLGQPTTLECPRSQGIRRQERGAAGTSTRSRSSAEDGQPHGLPDCSRSCPTRRFASITPTGRVRAHQASRPGLSGAGCRRLRICAASLSFGPRRPRPRSERSTRASDHLVAQATLGGRILGRRSNFTAGSGGRRQGRERPRTMVAGHRAGLAALPGVSPTSGNLPLRVAAGRLRVHG
jgi:hypothetical protein